MPFALQPLESKPRFTIFGSLPFAHPTSSLSDLTEYNERVKRINFCATLLGNSISVSDIRLRRCRKIKDVERSGNEVAMGGWSRKKVKRFRGRDRISRKGRREEVFRKVAGK